ncbi:MAG: hypothetical protein J1E38_04965 [Paramuribaculum sp.]|nr:hypothetical protein [Paramuribaculum sp.]
MKKFSLLSIFLTAGLVMSAQTALVEEVKHMLGQSKPDYAAALKKIQPALSDPSTMNTVAPWYYAGKAAFGVYDTNYLLQQLGNELTKEQKEAAGNAMLQGYNDFFVAIPLDVEVDKKTGQPKLDKDGKAKPGKFVKEMQKTLKDNYQHLLQAGIMFYDAQNYKGAYDVWEIYVNLPSNPILGSEKPTADADTLVGQIMYYQLLAALIDNQNEKALSKVAQIEKTGYQNIDVYVYGLQAASHLNNTAEVARIAKKGYELYGTQNIDFIGQLINECLDSNDYAGAQKLLNEAVAATPSDNSETKSRLINILGIVFERQDKFDQALEQYNKGIQADPNVAKNYYDAARIYYNTAVKQDEESADEYNVSPEVKEKLLKAADLFEKAYGLDEDNMTDVPNIMYNLYYRLGDEAKQNYWKNLR